MNLEWRFMVKLVKFVTFLFPLISHSEITGSSNGHKTVFSMKLLSSLLIAANAESACRGEIKDAMEEWRQEMDAYKNTKNGLL